LVPYLEGLTISPPIDFKEMVMHRQWTLAVSILVALVGVGLEPAIATPPASQAQGQKPSVCRQYGAAYQEVYTLEVDSQQNLTVCQKGNQYYYVKTTKSPISSALPAPNGSK
jgi:hypothetical protein